MKTEMNEETGYVRPAVEETVDVVALLTYGKKGGGGHGGYS